MECLHVLYCDINHLHRHQRYPVSSLPLWQLPAPVEGSSTSCLLGASFLLDECSHSSLSETGCRLYIRHDQLRRGTSAAPVSEVCFIEAIVATIEQYSPRKPSFPPYFAINRSQLFDGRYDISTVQLGRNLDHPALTRWSTLRGHLWPQRPQSNPKSGRKQPVGMLK